MNMNIIKVNITICFDNSENSGIAHGGIDLVKEIRLTDEQFEYLREVDRALGRKRRAEFQNLREDFQAMTKELVLPYTNFFHQQLVAEGTDDAAARAVIDKAYSCVSLWGPYFDNNEDDEDDDDLETEFDDDLDFSDLFNFDKSKEKDVSEELQGNMLAAFHGVTHHNVYSELPFMLHAGLTSSAEALLKKMAVDTLDFTTDGGKRIIVAKIPELTSEAGFVACILAITFEDNTGKYYIVELDDDQYFLDQMEHGCHKTYGARWTKLPTLQQVAEEVKSLKG